MQALAAVGPLKARSAVPYLKSIAENDRAYKRDAMLALIFLDVEGRAEERRIAASYDDFLTRAILFAALGETTPEAEAYIRAGMRRFHSAIANDDPWELISAIRDIVQLGPAARNSIPEISALLSHRDLSVRREAEKTLGVLNNYPPAASK